MKPFFAVLLVVLLLSFLLFVLSFVIASLIFAFQRSVPLKSRFRPLGIVLTVIFALFLCGRAQKRQDEAEWVHYTKYFGSPVTGNDALSSCGTPIRTEYTRDSQKYPEQITYTRLYYDGFSFGMGGGAEAKIRLIRVTKSGVMELRGGIDIGSSRREAEAAFAGASRISDCDGYIFRHPGEHAHDGIWLFLEFDERDILTAYELTDGY